MNGTATDAPAPAIEFILAPLVKPFLDAYPDVALELISDAAKVDIVDSGFDAGVRFGEELARDMVALPLGGSLRYIVIGAPDYLEAHGAPREPGDLLHHLCIRQRFPGGTIFAWRFEKGGRSITIVPEGRLTVNDARQAVRTASEALGLARVLEEYAEPLLGSGAVVRVLDDWCPRIPGWFLYYPGRRQVPSAMRAFLDFLVSRKALEKACPRAAGASWQRAR